VRGFIALSVLQDILGQAALFPQAEVGGILVGHLPAREQGATVVTDLIPALETDADRTHVTFTHATWQKIHESLDAREDETQIVGWYHTHPGFGPFYSAQDTFIHEQFFTHPAHIGLVVDPQQFSLTAFGWHKGRLQRLKGLGLTAPAAIGGEASEGEEDPVVISLRYVGEAEPESLCARLCRRLRRHKHSEAGEVEAHGP
jgi:proteasome lid subunit RPN8/RPN11